MNKENVLKWLAEISDDAGAILEVMGMTEMQESEQYGINHIFAVMAERIREKVRMIEQEVDFPENE